MQVPFLSDSKDGATASVCLLSVSELLWNERVMTDIGFSPWKMTVALHKHLCQRRRMRRLEKKERNMERQKRKRAAVEEKLKWTSPSNSCYFTCQDAAPLSSDGGWLVEARPFIAKWLSHATLSPQGEKMLFFCFGKKKKQEVHKPCCRLSCQQIIHSASSPPVQSAVPLRPVPPVPAETASGPLGKIGSNRRVHSSSCRCFFQPVTGLFALFQCQK